ncbi:MAG: FAD-dependent oxidoreductase [Lachnospiraceae bacterium]|nr:FAD-dependent oxidoreductase [Lachnospiraceae bacterium]MDY3275840.1 FAD-dependent oxidoreductase [Agathobacter sp.]MDY5103006.1 FAD-dependent oxidoreductase [Agathobacter sp.]
MLDAIIIGSGPAGLAAAIYGKRANLNIAVVEKEYEGTGQIAESSCVDNYLGLPGINGYDLGEQFRNHAVDFGVDFIEHEVVAIEKQPGGWKLAFEDGSSKEARTVIYAAGAQPRKADVPGEDRYIGKGVSYCAICDGAFYKGKTVAVLGGGDTAVDEALYLSDLCEKVYLIHRRTEFRGAAQRVEQARKKANIEFVLGETVKEFVGGEKLTAVRLNSGTSIELNGVFVAYGSKPQTELLRGIVALDDSGYVVANEDGRTSQEGFFVAGDVRTKTLRQVVTAVSDGANAITSVAEYIKIGAIGDGV